MTDAHRRLLDLLAGWDQYVSKCADQAREADNRDDLRKYERESDAIGLLYQQLGCVDEPTASDVAGALHEIKTLVLYGF
jgi:hypothetical protein